ncbi:MAG: hypothetical protein K0V04_43315 [Deltaproteobacteria bacterium]|nr:hypothetical protein [Deltaproteobacteria bacterium]
MTFHDGVDRYLVLARGSTSTGPAGEDEAGAPLSSDWARMLLARAVLEPDARALLRQLGASDGDAASPRPDEELARLLRDRLDVAALEHLQVFRLDPPTRPAVALTETPTALTHLTDAAVVDPLAPDTPVEVPVRVTWTEIRGLYRPGHDDGMRGAEGHRIACGYDPGYVSADGRGRVLVNHRPRASPSEPWSDVRQANTQYIELHVRVEPTRAGQSLPAGLQLRWIWEDVAAGQIPPVRASGASELAPSPGPSPHGLDNRGDCDFPSQAASRDPTWDPLDHPMTAGATPRECTTDVVDGRSSVRLHLTNVGGDSIRAAVALAPHGTAVAHQPAQTGVMTMWKRIDVEYRQMAGAPVLQVDRTAKVFETCNVQLDFTEPLSIPAQPHLTDDPDLWTQELAAQELASAPPRGAFAHAGEPGWFFVAGAHQSTSATTQYPTRSVWRGPGRLHVVQNSGGAFHEAVVVNWVPTAAERRREPVRLINLRMHPRSTESTYFVVRSRWFDQPRRGQTTFVLRGLQYVSEFVPGDGRNSRAYQRTTDRSPRYQRQLPGVPWQRGGLRFPSPDVSVIAATSRGGGSLRGLSPHAADSPDHFAGRVVLFTRMFEDSKTPGVYDHDAMVHTLCHELGHAFGFPHNCGYTTWHEGGVEACCMNTRHLFVYEPGTRDCRPFDTGRESDHFCPRHLDGIRRVHLEDNRRMWRW